MLNNDHYFDFLFAYVQNTRKLRLRMCAEIQRVQRAAAQRIFFALQRAERADSALNRKNLKKSCKLYIILFISMIRTF